MSLSNFIQTRMDVILGEWQNFAETVPAARHMDRKALRDEAEQILRRIAQNMEEPQSAEEQEAKSKGRGAEPSRDTAAQSHGGGRLSDGFTLNEMVAEFRALRASVIRLWVRDMGAADRDALYELTRFNEAIDQAWVESIARYSERLDRAREVFLGILGHDLRTPIAAASNSAHLLLRGQGLSEEQKNAASVVLRSTQRMDNMIGVLLDVVRARLGQRLPVQRHAADLAELCRHAVREARAHHPEHRVDLTAPPTVPGTWDGDRLEQLISNLLENAIRHGAADRPVEVCVETHDDVAELRVHNEGPPIPKALHARLFEPLTHAVSDDSPAGHGQRSSLGLGLYIAQEIAKAHGGRIGFDSAADTGTTFTVRLPREVGEEARG